MMVYLTDAARTLWKNLGVKDSETSLEKGEAWFLVHEYYWPDRIKISTYDLNSGTFGWEDEDGEYIEGKWISPNFLVGGKVYKTFIFDTFRTPSY